MLTMEHIDKLPEGIIAWVGAFLLFAWVMDVAFPRISWKLGMYAAHFKHRIRQHLPKWPAAKHHHRSDSAMDWQVSTETGSVCLTRASWGVFLFALVVAAGFGGSDALWLSLIGHVLKHEGSQGVGLLLMVVFVFLVCSGCVAVMCWILLSESISSVQFQLAEQRTTVTYLGIIRRTLSSLPSKIELGRGSIGSGFARLIFPGRKFYIPLFCTAKGSFDTSSQAIQYALKETAQLRETLHLEVKEID